MPRYVDPKRYGSFLFRLIKESEEWRLYIDGEYTVRVTWGPSDADMKAWKVRRCRHKTFESAVKYANEQLSKAKNKGYYSAVSELMAAPISIPVVKQEAPPEPQLLKATAPLRRKVRI